MDSGFIDNPDLLRADMNPGPAFPEFDFAAEESITAMTTPRPNRKR